jgi:NAD(P)-dependent dehydrogenase (short-subunit alcohol dehydrogenase family)
MNNTPSTAQHCFITGATHGIGKATAMALAQQGFHLYLMVRNAAKGEKIKQDIIQQTGNKQIELLVGDLSKLDDVRKVAAEFLAKNVPLHVLINNAGVVNTSRKLSHDGFEEMFGVNHLAHFLLTHLLMDKLKASAPSRIINVASDAHRFCSGLNFDDLQTEHTPFKTMKVYGASKLCNIYFTRTLATQLENTGVTVNALHPGWVGTALGANNGLFGKVVTTLQKPFAKSPQQGAQSSIYLASSAEVAGVNGKYYFNCKDYRPSKVACDNDAATKLWDISKKLCAI